MELTKLQLEELYLHQRKSSVDIASLLDCSVNKINYWLKKFSLPKRSISDAIYAKRNPGGDPFVVKEIEGPRDAILYGLGLGLYWGEGTKANKNSVRLGNTDPRLIKRFIQFLETIYGIKREKLHFGLQIFSDISAQDALIFWQKELNMPSRQFQKVIITPSRGEGTYRHKVKHGVLTVYYHNKKLRNIICNMIDAIDSRLDSSGS